MARDVEEKINDNSNLQTKQTVLKSDTCKTFMAGIGFFSVAAAVVTAASYVALNALAEAAKRQL